MYARATHAKGRCDRCGFAYPLTFLKEEVTDGRRNGLKVCPDCFDKDHPIYQRGRIRVVDPQTLRDPRPDYDRAVTTSYFGWAPIGNPNTRLEIALGDITIVTGA